MAQLSEKLQGRNDLKALHILSHGQPGALQLGSTWICKESLAAHADTLAQLGSALAESADMLIYGCNVAAGEEGPAFVAALAQATGANVAASARPTGAAQLGGDWELEFQMGTVKTPVAFPAAARAEYPGLLGKRLSSTQAVTASTVNAANTPPVLTDALLSLPPLNEDVGPPVNGSVTGSGTANGLLNTSVLHNYFDSEGGLPGLAITGVNPNGTLWYTLDGGAHWAEVGPVSETSARVLYVEQNFGLTRLYFQPNADYYGTLADAFTFRAWDRTGGYTNGQAGVNTWGSVAGNTTVGGFGNALDIAVNGQYAYVANGTGGFKILDLADPEHPTQAGAISSSTLFNNPSEGVTAYIKGVTVSGQYAYLAGGPFAGLRVVDIADPAHPASLGGYDTPGNANRVAVSGDYAFVADDYAGLTVVDVADPAHPVGKATLDTDGLAYDVAVSGNFAYVADWNYGLQVFNIADPEHPSRAGSYNDGQSNSGYALAVAVSGQYAYVADANAGLSIIDISNPAQPLLAGRLAIGYATEVAVSGHYAYLTDANTSSLKVVDIANPAQPRLAASLAAGSGTLTAVAVNGSHIYLTDSLNGLVKTVRLENAFSEASDTVEQTVNSVNDAPPVAVPASASGNEDTTIAVTLSGLDVDGPLASFKITSLSSRGDLYRDAGLTQALGLNATVGATNNQAVVYFMPDANYHGGAAFEFKAIDNQGAASPAVQALITINPVNDPPTAIDAIASGDEDNAIAITLSGEDVDANALISPNGISNARITSFPDHGTLYRDAGLTQAISGPSSIQTTLGKAVIYFKPEANWYGETGFSFSMSDSLGSFSAAASASITVNPVNDPPVAVPADITGNEDTRITVTLSGSDVDGPLASFQITSLSSSGDLYRDAGLTQPLALNATVGATNNQAVAYFKPDANYHGKAAFEFKAIDNQGAASPAVQALITINPVNDPPTAIDAIASGDEDNAIAITLSGEDVDADAPIAPNGISNARITSFPDHGTLYRDAGLTQAISGPSSIHATLGKAVIYFKPEANWYGETGFSFSMSDSRGSFSAAASASITVNPVNDPPVAKPTTKSGKEDTAIAVTLSGTDVDDGIANFRITGLPSHGSLYRDADLTQALSNKDTVAATNNKALVYFQPSLNFRESDRFPFEAIDGQNATSQRVVASITVNNVSDVPVAIETADQGDEDSVIKIVLSGEDADGIGQVSSIKINSLPDHGSLYKDQALTQKLALDAKINTQTHIGQPVDQVTVYFKPDANWHGGTSFLFDVSDGMNRSASATASITVDPINDLPSGAITINGTVRPGQVLTADTSNLKDADGLGTLSYQWQRANPDGSGPVNIGANQSTYLLTDADIGKVIKTTVSYTDGDGTKETKASLPTSVILSKTQGTEGDDNLVGTADADIIDGLGGNDILDGGAGNDRLTGGTGIDRLIGGTGNDAYYVDNPGDVIQETSALAGEIDGVFSTISWTLGNNLENLSLLGSANINATGNASGNILNGNSASNILDGKLGIDTLKGGAGQDYFRFSTEPSFPTNTDTIQDFNLADDTIQLDRSVFASLSPGVLPASQFRGGAGMAAAADSNDYLIYNTTTGFLLYDADGNGSGGAKFIAIIGSSYHAALTNADFVAI